MVVPRACPQDLQEAVAGTSAITDDKGEQGRLVELRVSGAPFDCHVFVLCVRLYFFAFSFFHWPPRRPRKRCACLPRGRCASNVDSHTSGETSRTCCVETPTSPPPPSLVPHHIFSLLCWSAQHGHTSREKRGRRLSPFPHRPPVTQSNPLAYLRTHAASPAFSFPVLFSATHSPTHIQLSAPRQHVQPELGSAPALPEPPGRPGAPEELRQRPPKRWQQSQRHVHWWCRWVWWFRWQDASEAAQPLREHPPTPPPAHAAAPPAPPPPPAAAHGAPAAPVRLQQLRLPSPTADPRQHREHPRHAPGAALGCHGRPHAPCGRPPERSSAAPVQL